MNYDNDVAFRLKSPTEGYNYLRFLKKQRLRDLERKTLRQILDKKEHPENVKREYK